jgi:hypothetical protein
MVTVVNSLTQIINDKHTKRLTIYIDDAINKGAVFILFKKMQLIHLQTYAAIIDYAC